MKTQWAVLMSILAFQFWAQPSFGESYCRSSGPHNFLVVVGSYPEAISPQPSVDYLRELFSGTRGDVSIKDFMSQVSKGQLSMANIDFIGPIQVAHKISFSPGVEDPEQILEHFQSELLSVASQTIDVSKYDRVLYFTPAPINLKNGEEAHLGAGLASNYCDLDVGGPRKIGHAWVKSDQRYARGLPREDLVRAQKVADMQPIMHEIGHTLGLGHANTVARPRKQFSKYVHDEILPDETTPLYQLQYADNYSFMSSSTMGSPSLPHLVFLKWIPKKLVKTVDKPGVFRITPFADAGKGLKGLKVPRLKSSDQKTKATFWVEYRRPATLYDRTGLTSLLDMRGPLIYYTNPDQPSPRGWNWPNETLLLHFLSPHSLEEDFPTDFTLKGSWKDPHSLVGFKVLQIQPDFVDIQVDFSN